MVSPQPSRGSGRSALRNGLFTGVGAVVLGGSAAVAGALLAHKFGRTAETDGFLAAYGCYLVLTIGAQAFRLVVLPDLTRAAAEERMGAELRGYGIAFLAAGGLLVALCTVFAHDLGDLITSRLPAAAATAAADALPWLLAAAVLQLLAGVAASGLAALDRYGVAALGYAGGGLVGLIVFLVLADSHGIVSLAWGLTANGAFALALPLTALAVRGDLRGAGSSRVAIGPRLWRVVEGAALPLALQACYLVALRLAAGLGIGRVTSLSYAYLLVASLAYVPSFSISVISSAPLTRRDIDDREAVEHVLHASWVSLLLVGGAAGVFALVGGRLVELVLGHSYGGGTGREIGHLVIELAPWMVGTVAFYVTFPVLFVLRRQRLLIALAVAALVFDAAVSLGLRTAGGLFGIALGLGIAVIAVVSAILRVLSRDVLLHAAAGLARLAVVVGATAAIAFGVSRVFLPAVPAAAAGLAAYSLLVFVAASRLGLGETWAYVRALH